nr:MAG TPA: hypothetical protein [Caudoviricetes sp.]
MSVFLYFFGHGIEKLSSWTENQATKYRSEYL